MKQPKELLLPRPVDPVVFHDRVLDVKEVIDIPRFVFLAIAALTLLNS